VGEAYEGANRLIATNSFTRTGPASTLIQSSGILAGFSIPITFAGFYHLYMVCTIPRTSNGNPSHLVDIAVDEGPS
jgi:hypothetical protein